MTTKHPFTGQPMRYLGWKEPFATMMLFDKEETRTWPTDYRGLVLITASMVPYNKKQLLRIAGEDQIHRIWQTLEPHRKRIQPLYGYGIAVGRLVDCQPMLSEHEDKCFVKYQPGLWRHIYSDVVAIKPIRVKGAQGWRKLDREFIDKIELIEPEIQAPPIDNEPKTWDPDEFPDAIDFGNDEHL